MINTVMGPVSPDKLGRTLVHEHFCFGNPGWSADVTMAPYDPDAVLEAGLQAIEAAKAVGIQTIVDATPNDAGGRDPLMYRELSKRTGMTIICATGLYTENGGAPAYWQARLVWGNDISKMMADLMIKEITDGIGPTGVKAGVIKVASGPVMTPYEEAVHRAAVVAQRATGVPIITHTEGPSGGPEQAAFLLKHGADPRKTMIGHANNSGDVAYHRAILARGTRVGFDRLGLGASLKVPDDVSARNIARLCREGFLDKILLSHDTVAFWLGRPWEIPEKDLHMFIDYKIDFVSRKILPMLKEDGLTDSQIDTMMIENPKNLFLGK
jgi:phosphotriesterase-related protein